ncbi:MAG: hypothetical protein MRQ09_04110, partial [Candidatus Midichloria sp.]|nr:hypothetical protein [Candidatus Midichloria sp.]
ILAIPLLSIYHSILHLLAGAANLHLIVFLYPIFLRRYHTLLLLPIITRQCRMMYIKLVCHNSLFVVEA